MNMHHNLVLGFTTWWFNQLDQINIKVFFFNQIFAALFIELSPFKQTSLDYKSQPSSNVRLNKKQKKHNTENKHEQLNSISTLNADSNEVQMDSNENHTQLRHAD